MDNHVFDKPGNPGQRLAWGFSHLFGVTTITVAIRCGTCHERSEIAWEEQQSSHRTQVYCPVCGTFCIDILDSVWTEQQHG